MKFKLNKTDYADIQIEELNKAISPYGIALTYLKEYPAGSFQYRIDTVPKSEKTDYFYQKVQTNTIAFYCKDCCGEIFAQYTNLSPDISTHRSIRDTFGEEAKSALFANAKEISAKYKEITEKEKQELSKTDICPYCGAKLSTEGGYYENSFNSHSCTAESIFSSMRKTRENFFKYEADKKAKDFLEAANAPTKGLVYSGAQIKASAANLKAYIQAIIDTEAHIYTLKKRLPELYSNASILKMELNEAKAKAKEALLCPNEALENELKKAQRRLEDYQKGIFPISAPIAPKPPTLQTPGLFNKKKVEEENERLAENYAKAQAEYAVATTNYATQTAALLAEARKDAEIKKQALEKDKEEKIKAANVADKDFVQSQLIDIINEETIQAQNALTELFKKRNLLYASDVIYPKYRDIVALTTFLEYLSAGRCSSLEGHEGAYNIYENELRQNIIIGQLSNVLTELEKIKQNQIMVYNEVKKMNLNLETLNTTMDNMFTEVKKIGSNIAKIADISQVIAHNTKVSAYYSQVNAFLSASILFNM